MTRKSHRVWSLLGSIVALVGGCALAWAQTGGGSCCYTQHCAGGDVTDCIAACGSNQVCMGNGGCNPAWAKASCGAQP